MQDRIRGFSTHTDCTFFTSWHKLYKAESSSLSHYLCKLTIRMTGLVILSQLQSSAAKWSTSSLKKKQRKTFSLYLLILFWVNYSGIAFFSVNQVSGKPQSCSAKHNYLLVQQSRPGSSSKGLVSANLKLRQVSHFAWVFETPAWTFPHWYALVALLKKCSWPQVWRHRWEKTPLLWHNEPAGNFLLQRETCARQLWDHTITGWLRGQQTSGGHLGQEPCSGRAT